MKTFPVAIQAHFESPRLTVALLCKATRADGTVHGFTDVDIDIPFDSVLYESGAIGITMSATEISDQLSADNNEVTGFISSDAITRDDILSGKWDLATLQFRLVNFRSLGDGYAPEATGTIGKISTGELGFTVEFLDYKQKLQQNLLRKTHRMCGAILGDERCKVDLAPFTETLTVEVTTDPDDPQYGRLVSDSARTEATGWWNGGNATVATAANAASVGLKMEIKSSTATGDFEFLLPFYFGLEVGDTLTITPGCNHQKLRADGYTGDCVVKFDNAINYRGFDRILGTDDLLSYQ